MIPGQAKTKIHFIGIGGIGVSAIAHILLDLGYEVSGSDLNRSGTIEVLEKLGAEISIGHHSKNILGPSAVVYSSAIKQDNPELVRARQLNLPVYRRAEILADLMRLKYGIAVAGTHGKTTTTSMLATIFTDAGLDPSYIIGGIVKNLGLHAKVGKGNYLIAETDESDGTFLLMRSVCSIVTNIDCDHMDYHGSLEELKEAFVRFINKTPFYGICAINILDENISKILTQLKVPYVGFEVVDKFCAKAKYEAVLKTSDSFEVRKDNLFFGNFSLNVRGKYNVENALGAIAICDYAGIEIDKITSGLAKFEGAKRRMDVLYKSKDLEIIDDYAHHPTEIKAVIDAFKGSSQEITVFFEPHRYTRLKEHWDEFQNCFKDADQVFLLPVYAASETEIEGINSLELNVLLNKRGVRSSLLKKVTDRKLSFEKISSGVVLCLGAGSISKEMRLIVDELF